MPYTLPSWADFPSTATPVDAANLTLLNDAIDDLDARANDPLDLGSVFSFPPYANDPTARAMNAANEAVYWRCVGAGTFDQVALRVSTASGNVCVGVYADSSGVPGSRVATTGSVACPASGASTALTLDNTVTATHGSHWFAFVADNTTATFVVQIITPLSDTNLYTGVGYTQGTAFPLPTSTASLTASARRIPLIRGV